MPTISVIVPVYKVEPYLLRCVDSILGQTFNDFELVLVDDGSPDNCPAICDEYAAKDARVVVIHQENGGVSAARNAGIDWALANSESQWLTFIDSDDWVHPEYLERLLNAAVDNGVDISVCGYVQTSGEEPEITSEELQPRIWDPEAFFVEYNVNATVPWGKLYRKRCFGDVRYPVGKIHEDEFTTYKILFDVNKLAVLFVPLYRYYINQSSIMKSAWRPERMQALDAYAERITFFKMRGYQRLYDWTLSKYIWYIIAMREYVMTLTDRDMAEKYPPILMERLRKELRAYRKELPVADFAGAYELVFPREMQMYWYLQAAQRKIKRLFLRVYHLWERILRELKSLPARWHVFGPKVALETFRDGLIPPGKSARYIRTIEAYVDGVLSDLTASYRDRVDEGEPALLDGKIPVWCCWWQGEEAMPELVKMCHTRLKQVLPADRAQLHLITLENYREYVDLPEHIVDKFRRKVITMTTMSDVLRFALLEKYGGYWLDATVFFTGSIPGEYFSGDFYCQRMVNNTEMVRREACRGNWCGFSMAGPRNSIVFRFMNDAFSLWWKKYDTIVDYVLIDYLLWTGFRSVPAIRETIDKVPDNNEDIFEMYQVLNQPYTPELLERLTKRNVMHKLTYKMDLHRRTPEGEQTLYGYLWDQVYGTEGETYHGINGDH